jgi:hypothetical protein
MNTCFEFHDSVLAEIKEEAGRCLLRFHPAYIHRSEGRPGIDVGDGFTQDLQIVIGGAKIRKMACVLPTEISGGSITVGDTQMLNCAPVPFLEKKKISLKILPASASGPIEIEGSSIEIRTAGEAVSVESFPGAAK